VSQHFGGAVRTVVRAHGATGQRPPEPHGKVSVGRIAKLFVGQGYGFIRTVNSREIYFHRTDLREGTSVNDLRISDRVIFELLEDRVSGARAVRVAEQGHR
jgi:cold shock CspA family protein